MGSHKKKGATYRERVTVPPPDLNVTGEVSPDCTCNYFETGTYNGQPLYRRLDGTWFICYHLTYKWMISQTPGATDTYAWNNPLGELLGNYNPWGLATGVATVAEGGH